MSTGPAPLLFKEVTGTEETLQFGVLDNIVSERVIQPCRSRMKVTGGLMYDPGYMAEMLTKQRKGLDDFAAIPNVLTRLLTTNPGLLDGNREVIFATFTKLIDILEGYIEDVTDRLRNASQHSSRFEFFFMSSLRSSLCDVEFPILELDQFLYVVDHKVMMEEIIADFDENLAPLVILAQHLRVDPDSNGSMIQNPECLHPCVKTRLVSCSELIVAMIDVKGFQGRIMKRLKDETDESGQAYKYFTIPANFKIDLTGLVGVIGGISFGLDPRLLKLPPVSCILSDSRHFALFQTSNPILLLISEFV